MEPFKDAFPQNKCYNKRLFNLFHYHNQLDDFWSIFLKCLQFLIKLLLLRL